MPVRLREEKYDQRLARFGKAQRLEPYVNQKTRILHRCLIHGEEWLATPNDLAQGHGMKCCGRVLHDEAKAKYDERLAAIGLAERVDPYLTRRKAIRHRCLRHGRIFLQEPRRALEGRIPPCCGGMWRGSLYAMLLEPKRWGLDSHSVVYLFRLARFPGYVKIGITANIKTRANEEYGDFVCYWATRSRFHAFLIEQATLGDLSLDATCPPDLINNKWAGNTEVRRADSDDVIKVIQFYSNELEDLGPYRFVLRHLKPSEVERDLCEQALVDMV